MFHPNARARLRVILTSLILSTAFTGCMFGDDEESRGTIAMVSGEVKILSETERAEVCASAYCEPNYVYKASFGSHHRDPDPAPRPAPPPVYSPPPPFPNAYAPQGDVLDYSRARMGVGNAWRTTTGSRDVIVAVVDTGVTVSHPDLAQNIWVNQAEASGRPGVDDDGNGYVDDVYGYDFANNRPNAIDDNNHGTHCAGIIGAQLNGSGTAGVSPNVRIMPLKFLAADGSGDTMAAIAAINYAVANGAQVISNSWGGGGRSELLNQAIQNAIARGVLVVAAAGNSTNNNDASPNYPASYDGVISVASTDAADAMSGFSNYGRSSVMVAAPGSYIYSSITGNRWGFMSGTSMATPQVAGALALALSLKKPLSADQMKAELCNTSDRIHLDQVRCGRINVDSLIRSVAAK